MTVAASRRPASRDAPSDSLTGLAIGIAAVGAIVVLYFTLFPFDFVDRGKSLGEILRGFSLSASTPWALREVPANVLLTIPLGFGLGGVVSVRTSSTPMAVLVALIGALVLSSAVELAQSAWLLRDPSVDDIVANTVGGALGAWLWTRAEPALRELRRRQADVVPQRARSVAWFVVALLPVVVVSTIVVATRHDTELAGWDRGIPLVLGNEVTGDRPWRGSVSRFSLADRALTRAEVARLLDGARMREVAPGSTLVDHDFRDDPGVPGGWSVRGAEQPRGAASSAVGLELGPDQWIETDEPADRISRRIDTTDSFTLLIDAASASSSQRGPARLVSLSSDPHHTNFTVGQHGSALVVRVRSSFTGTNGISPQFMLPGVFESGRSRRLVVRYDPSSVSVTVDRIGDTANINLLPETVPLVATFADNVSILRFSAVGNTARQVFIATILFAPWAVWMGLMAFPQRRRAAGPLLALVVVPIVVIEALWARTVPGHQFRAGFVVASAATAALIAFVIRRTARRQSTR